MIVCKECGSNDVVQNENGKYNCNNCKKTNIDIESGEFKEMQAIIAMILLEIAEKGSIIVDGKEYVFTQKAFDTFGENNKESEIIKTIEEIAYETLMKKYKTNDTEQ